jgi:hypothetical protein
MITSAIRILLLVTAYGFIHSLLASLWAKDQARRLFGSVADRLYRLVYNGIAVITFLPMLALTAALPGRILYRLQLPWSLILLGVQIFAILMLALGVLQTGMGSFMGLRSLISPIEFGIPQLVVVSGIYL